MNPYLCGFLFFLTFGGLNITPKNEEHEKDLFTHFRHSIYFPVQAQHTLRLMTYNIKNANGMDDICSFQRVANVINNASPDVVAIQEVDSMTRRSGQKYVLGEIAERTQMHACFAPAIEFEGGKYGIGLLTKQVPLRLQTIPLPGREEARTLILAEFEDYIYCCTHLSLTEGDRMKSLEIVKSLIASYKKPLFLAGDMNAEPESDFIKELQKDFQILSNPEKHTYPAPDPKEAIDYIAVSKQNATGFAVISAKVVNELMASDHRPILVELRTAEKADKIFRTKPYLQNPVGNGITVMWETTVPSYCWVEYGTDTTRLERARMIVDGQVVCNNKLHKIRIDGLQPGQKYYYRVCSQEMLLYQAYKRYLEIQHNRPSVNLLFLLLIQSLLPLLFLMICINIPILSVLYVNKYRMLSMILLFSMVTVWMILWITSRQPHLSVN